MSELKPSDYSDKAVKQFNEGKPDEVHATLNQAFLDLNPAKFNEVVKQMTKAVPDLVIERDKYKDIPDYPKTVRMNNSTLFSNGTLLFSRKN